MLFFSNLAKAGWYEVYTYDGVLANSEVHFCIQLRAINSNNPDSILVSGLYKYNHINDPLELRGYLINNDTMILTEFHDEKPFATLKFKWGTGDISGEWSGRDDRNFKIRLSKTESLSDINSKSRNGPCDVLMGSSFLKEYLVATYEKPETSRRAYMTEIKVLSKKDHSLITKITFESENRPVGNVSTVIFANAYSFEDPESGTKTIEISVDDGRMGESFILKYDEKSNKFNLN